MKPPAGRTIVVACTQHRGEVWCRLQGIPPRDRGTFLVSRPDHLRGDRARPDDRLVLLGGGFEEWRAEQLELFLGIAGHDLYDAEWVDG